MNAKKQFWFHTFELVLDGISHLTGEMPESIELTDWNILTKLPASRSITDVQGIFYPNAPAEILADLEAFGHSHRRPRFLTTYDDIAYHQLYQTILENHDLQFPDIQAVLRNGRQDGKVLSQVMNHVSQWLNPDSTPKVTLFLQQRIFNLVRGRMGEFADGGISSYLSKLPNEGGDAYLERFSCQIWRDLLIRVHEVAGARFQGSLAKFNNQHPTSLPAQSEPSLMRALRETVSRMPEISGNPALRSSKAIDALLTTLSTWATQQIEEALRAQRLGQMPLWPPKIRELVLAQQSELGAMVSAPIHADVTVSAYTPPPSIAGPGSVQSERYDGEGAIEDLPDDLQMGSIGPREPEEPGDGTHQGSLEETPRAESSFLDMLPDQMEMKKRQL